MTKRISKPFCELRCEFVRHGYLQRDIAQKINCCQTLLSQKLMGDKPFSLPEVYILCDTLGIPEENIPMYFPRKEMSKLLNKE
jgi:hypothetical protein